MTEAGQNIEGCQPSRGNAWLRLGIGAIAVGVIWLLVLPWLARQPWFRDRAERYSRAGIRPSAMFYTEVEEPRTPPRDVTRESD